MPAALFLLLPPGLTSHTTATVAPFSLSPTDRPPQIKHKLVALSGLKEKLGEMHVYLQQVLDGKLPVNNQVPACLMPAYPCLPARLPTLVH